MSVYQLPFHVLLYTHSFLVKDELLSCSCVSSLWKMTADSDSLWKPICLSHWKGKKLPMVANGVGGYREDISTLRNGLDDPIRSISTRELRKNLARKGIDTSKCIEKGELLCLFRASSLEGPSNARELLKAESLLWIKNMSSWKFSYVFAERDSKRTVITRDELVENDWWMSFHDAEGHGPVRSTFHTNYSFTNEWYHQDPIPWRWVDEGEVRVADYPSLIASRTASWGWELTNQHVLFTQQPIQEAASA